MNVVFKQWGAWEGSHGRVFHDNKLPFIPFIWWISCGGCGRTLRLLAHRACVVYFIKWLVKLLYVVPLYCCSDISFRFLVFVHLDIRQPWLKMRRSEPFKLYSLSCLVTSWLHAPAVTGHGRIGPVNSPPSWLWLCMAGRRPTMVQDTKSALISQAWLEGEGAFQTPILHLTRRICADCSNTTELGTTFIIPIHWTSKPLATKMQTRKRLLRSTKSLLLDKRLGTVPSLRDFFLLASHTPLIQFSPCPRFVWSQTAVELWQMAWSTPWTPSVRSPSRRPSSSGRRSWSKKWW